MKLRISGLVYGLWIWIKTETSCHFLRNVRLVSYRPGFITGSSHFKGSRVKETRYDAKVFRAVYQEMGKGTVVNGVLHFSVRENIFSTSMN